MERMVRLFGVAMLAGALVAGCGEGENTLVVENDNAVNGTPTPILTPTFGATPVRTATPRPTETEVPPTATPESEATETPGAEETETPAPGSTFTPGGGPSRTPTPKPTKTTTPTPEPTVGGPFCGNGVKEAGEECDTGTSFAASSADCASQCTCCLCRPDFHDVPGAKCSVCHPSIAPPLTYPPGAAQTFPGLCE
jgi:hypothetical protein